MAAILGICLDVLHYVRPAALCFMLHNIVNVMTLWNVMYKHYDRSNQRFSYVNERHFGFMLITY